MRRRAIPYWRRAPLSSETRCSMRVTAATSRSTSSRRLRFRAVSTCWIRAASTSPTFTAAGLRSSSASGSSAPPERDPDTGTAAAEPAPAGGGGRGGGADPLWWGTRSGRRRRLAYLRDPDPVRARPRRTEACAYVLQTRLIGQHLEQVEELGGRRVLRQRDRGDAVQVQPLNQTAEP